MNTKKIIIGGPPRSGTTLLRVMLGSVGGLVDLPETSFFCFPLSINQNRVERISKRLSKVLDIDKSKIESIIMNSSNSSMPLMHWWKSMRERIILIHTLGGLKKHHITVITIIEFFQNLMMSISFLLLGMERPLLLVK